MTQGTGGETASALDRQLYEALCHSGAVQQAILKALPDLVFRIRRDGTYIDFHGPSGFAPYVPPPDFVGKKVSQIMPPPVAQEAMEAIERAFQTGDLQIFEYELLQGGEPRQYQARLVVCGQDEVLCVVRDATRQNHARQALTESNQTLQALIQAAPLAIIALDLGGKVRMWNPAAERMFGYSEAEVLGRLPPIIPPERQEIFARMQARVLEKGETIPAEEGRPVRKDGTSLYATVYLAPLRNAAGQIIGSMGMVEDITERRQMREELRALTQRLLAAQDDERRSLSRELHDGLSQSLAMLAEDVEALLAEPPGAQQVKDRLLSFQQRVDSMAGEVRRMAHRLHPSILDHLGLEPALRSYCAEWARREGVELKFTARNLPEKLPLDVASCLYRVVQESLHNISRHAQSGKASVAVVGGGGAMRLVVKDYGVGFEPDAIRGARLGLISMRERVRHVNGVFNIESRPGHGAVIEARIPLVEEQKQDATKSAAGR
ncbi:MAG: PAS domain S-box protein [Acidobacteria bacterium]|nr:PAS domain S-box protein [Acidobacteriota bacterium]